VKAILIIAAACVLVANANAQLVPTTGSGFTSAQAEFDWMYQQILNLQVASSNEQGQLTTIENNPVLKLGQFVNIHPVYELIKTAPITFKLIDPPNITPKLYIISAPAH
jgi:hypothetical protein